MEKEDMSQKKKRHFTGEQKVAIIREHLLEKVPVSDICRKYDMRPAHFYRWQKEFFERGTQVFDQVHNKHPAEGKLKAENEALQEKLRAKNEVVSELMEEFIALKKKLGDK